MTKAIQIKLLAAILGVLCILAAILISAGRPVRLSEQDRQNQRKVQKKMVRAEPKRYLVP